MAVRRGPVSSGAGGRDRRALQAVPFGTDAEDPFGDDAVQPGGGAGVPGPAGAAVERGARAVDVAGEDVGLGPIRSGSLYVGSMAWSSVATSSGSFIFAAAAMGQVAAWV